MPASFRARADGTLRVGRRRRICAWRGACPSRQCSAERGVALAPPRWLERPGPRRPRRLMSARRSKTRCGRNARAPRVGGGKCPGALNATGMTASQKSALGSHAPRATQPQQATPSLSLSDQMRGDVPLLVVNEKVCVDGRRSQGCAAPFAGASARAVPRRCCDADHCRRATKIIHKHCPWPGQS